MLVTRGSGVVIASPILAKILAKMIQLRTHPNQPTQTNLPKIQLPTMLLAKLPTIYLPVTPTHYLPATNLPRCTHDSLMAWIHPSQTLVEDSEFAYLATMRKLISTVTLELPRTNFPKKMKTTRRLLELPSLRELSWTLRSRLARMLLPGEKR